MRSTVDDVITGVVLVAVGIGLRTISIPLGGPGLEVGPMYMAMAFIGWYLSPIGAAIAGGLIGFIGPMIGGGDPVPTSLFWIVCGFGIGSATRLLIGSYDPREKSLPVKLVVLSFVMQIISEGNPWTWAGLVSWTFWSVPPMVWFSLNAVIGEFVMVMPGFILAYIAAKGLERAFKRGTSTIKTEKEERKILGFSIHRIWPLIVFIAINIVAFVVLSLLGAPLWF